MKTKVVLLARLKAPCYPYVPVEIKRGQPAPVENASYYLRYQDSRQGKRVTEPVGSNLEKAFVKYQNKELDQTRARMGLPPSSTPGRVRIVDAVKKYLDDLENKVRSG